jgi:uncharacterized protein
MAKPSSPRRPKRAPSPRPRQRGGGGGKQGFRAVLALFLVAAAVAAVLLIARRQGPGVEPAPAPSRSPVAVVREVASRSGCPPQRVVEEAPRVAGGPIAVTVHAPRGFPVDTFTQRLQAEAHNSGDRLDPRPLTEKGGYGLARLDGTIAGRRVRVVVIGEEPRPTPAPQARPQAAAALAIVLDDAGNSLAAVRELQELPHAVAVAVLPNAVQSREVVRELQRQGREVLLHMPMEPLPNQGPGPGEGAVLVGQSAAEVASRLERALEIVATARGINNHMGSRATADLPTMQSVMSFLRGRGLYFLDSRTTSATVAEQAARAVGVPTLHREVFLDNVDEPDAVRRRLEEAISRASADGSAVAIGHVHPVTVAVLAAELGSLPADVHLVRPSQLLE